MWTVECRCREFKMQGKAYFCLECNTLILMEWNVKLDGDWRKIGPRKRLLAVATNPLQPSCKCPILPVRVVAA